MSKWYPKSLADLERIYGLPGTKMLVYTLTEGKVRLANSAGEKQRLSSRVLPTWAHFPTNWFTVFRYTGDRFKILNCTFLMNDTKTASMQVVIISNRTTELEATCMLALACGRCIAYALPTCFSQLDS